MSTIVLIAIIVAGVALAVFLVLALRRYMQERTRQKQRLASEVAGHRQVADAHVSKAGELGGEVERLREEAEDERAEAARHRAEATKHAELAQRHETAAEDELERADELEERVSREGRGATFHDERATELEKKL